MLHLIFSPIITCQMSVRNIRKGDRNEKQKEVQTTVSEVFCPLCRGQAGKRTRKNCRMLADSKMLTLPPKVGQF